MSPIRNVVTLGVIEEMGRERVVTRKLKRHGAGSRRKK